MDGSNLTQLLDPIATTASRRGLLTTVDAGLLGAGVSILGST